MPSSILRENDHMHSLEQKQLPMSDCSLCSPVTAKNVLLQFRQVFLESLTARSSESVRLKHPADVFCVVGAVPCIRLI